LSWGIQASHEMPHPIYPVSFETPFTATLSGLFCTTKAETSVLFELIAHRYERKSLLVTANQPFSQWNTIFADDMMTVAAVDRLVHHALIVQLQAESYRKRSADQRSQTQDASQTTHSEVGASTPVPAETSNCRDN